MNRQDLVGRSKFRLGLHHYFARSKLGEMKFIAAVLVLVAFVTEIMSSSSSFVRAHVGGQAALFNFLHDHSPDHNQPEVDDRNDLKTRRFSFKKDTAIASHGSTYALAFVIQFPDTLVPYGFHYVERPPQDFSESIFQPPKRA